MREITIARRKYQKETYTFILNLPEYKGETGYVGIEIKPYISVETPENALGYTDTFLYNEQENDGYFLHRKHPEWIKEKIIDTCKRLFDKSVAAYA